MASPETALELIGLQKEWMAAWGRRDRVALEAILAPEFTLTSSVAPNLISRERWLEMATGEAISDQFQYHDFNITVIGETAIVKSRAILTTAVEGVDTMETMLVTDVWIRRAERWQVVARHSSAPQSLGKA